MVERIKTFILVSVITVLVWVFAEAESLQRRDISVAIQFVTDTPGDLAIEADEGLRCKVSLAGNASSIAAADELAHAGPIVLHAGSPGIPAVPGDYLVSLRDALRNDPQLRNLGLSIDRVEPAEAKVRVEAVEMRQARVVVDVGEAELDGVPEVKPANARLYVPSELAGAVGKTPEVFATLRPEDLARLVAGKRETVPQVRLELPLALKNKKAARVEPQTAQVTLAVRTRQATTELSGVPVQVRMAPGELSRWDIAIPEQDRFVPKVKVSGPADLVEQVKRGEIKVTATVSLSFEDLEKGISQKEVVFCDLPSPLKFETESRLIHLTVKKREK